MSLVEEWTGLLTALYFMVYHSTIDSGKISECDLKLVDIDSEHLGIPNSTYDAAVHMSSVGFQKTVRDLQQISDSGKRTPFMQTMESIVYQLILFILR
jgi:hypothetical protein